MTSHATSLHAQDLESVGTRVRWGPILAGGTLALALYFLLTVLGAAVGLAISDRVNPTTLTTGAIAWTFCTTCAALFVGGLVTSLFTVGENKTEAVLYGMIMWGLLFVAFLGLGAAGIRGGFNAMAGMANTTQTTSPANWETGAREAGVSAAQIEDWRRSQGTFKAIQDPQNQTAITEAATRATWYAFAGMWLSMLAAAAGALVGAGPVFRLVVLPSGHELAARRREEGRLSPEGTDGARGFATSASP